MAVVAHKLKPVPERRIFHAAVLVTRAEEWWVEAETVEEARALLASGHGHRAAPGERTHVELQEIFEEAGG